MKNHEKIPATSNNLRNEMLKQASRHQWDNAINEINNSDALQRQENKAKIKRLFDSWDELDTQEEQQEILEVINSMENISMSTLKLVLQEKQSLTQDEQKQQLALAAITAISDYTPDGELNVFSNLEGEDFYQDIEIIGNNL